MTLWYNEKNNDYEAREINLRLSLEEVERLAGLCPNEYFVIFGTMKMPESKSGIKGHKVIFKDYSGIT